MKKGYIINKIELETDRKRTIEISSSNIRSFFQMSRISSRRPLKTLSLKLNKIKLIKLLVSAYFRKAIGQKIGMTEKSLISLFSPGINMKKIEYLHIYINSKKISFDIKKIHLSNLLGDLRGVVMNNQYNIHPENIKDKVIIDAGAHNGEFSMLAALLGAKKVYAFEPVSETSKMLRDNIKLSKMSSQITVIQKALGNKEETQDIAFNFIGDGAAKIGDIYFGKDSEKIEVVTLDNFVKKNKIKNIDFIKMDIEGFEENALLGAKNTIKTQKPILSFSAYHKPDDKVRLPKTVKSIREDYKIVLNKFDEEDFYCY